MSAPIELAVELRKRLGPSLVVAGDARAGALFGFAGEVAPHRYMLWRTWDDGVTVFASELPILVWWMLNPSTADHLHDDQTVRRCIAFAKMWGFGGIIVVNCYGLRSTSPAAMLRHRDRVGAQNDTVLRAVIDRQLRCEPPSERPRVVVAWGEHIELEREDAITALLLELAIGTHCLGRTKRGRPRHPSRLAYDTPLEPWP